MEENIKHRKQSKLKAQCKKEKKNNVNGQKKKLAEEIPKADKKRTGYMYIYLHYNDKLQFITLLQS